MSGGAQRLAVVLFNLGGPDGPADVRPFLRNLFGDPAILPGPTPVRRTLAAIISGARAAKARANYALMGGGSPLLGHTRDQAAALEAALQGRGHAETRVFIAMRHWRPDSEAAARAVEAFAPDRVVLVPLYPQFSTTTTGSSLAAWQAAWRGRAAAHVLCCWWDLPGLAKAHAEAIESTWAAAGRPKVRLLFSAHGLPASVIARGDPYQWQVEGTCRVIAAGLGAGWDWRLCYQSRVGPMRWLGPSIREAIDEAAKDGVGVLVDPVAFVSEHIETLVELDRDYADHARAAGVPVYLRAPAVGCAPTFIDGLAEAIVGALSHSGTRPAGEACPAAFGRCACREAAR